MPFALVGSGARGLRLTAVNAAAFAAGVRPQMPLADARAVLPSLLTRPAEPENDMAGLAALTRWAGRYGPQRHVDGSDGLWIDTTGVAHLFGSETEMLRDLVRRLTAFGFTVRAAIAPTHGAAHALARHAASARRPVLCVADGEAALRRALAPLPVAALRLDPDAIRLARRLGLKRIGDLYPIPRDSLARRFRDTAAPLAALLARLDAALGLAPEPRAGLAEPLCLVERASFAEPLVSPEGIAAAVADAAAGLCARLDAAGLGLRRARLDLQRADGTRARVEIGTAAATADPAHLAALLAPKLETVDAGFGIDTLVLQALRSEPLAPTQTGLAAADRRPTTLRGGASQGASSDLSPVLLDAGGGVSDLARARLVDRLAGRLGARRVVALGLAPSHIPEQADCRIPLVADSGPDSGPADSGPAAAAAAAYAAGASARAPAAAGLGFARAHAAAARPPLLLAVPEPIAVMAEVPDGPPLRFTWRRVDHRVAAAEGPERIAPEWWRSIGVRVDADQSPQAMSLGVLLPRATHPRTRDYYRVEDTGGGRFWLYREGLYGRAEEEGAPRWFMHGLFG